MSISLTIRFSTTKRVSGNFYVLVWGSKYCWELFTRVCPVCTTEHFKHQWNISTQMFRSRSVWFVKENQWYGRQVYPISYFGSVIDSLGSQSVKGSFLLILLYAMLKSKILYRNDLTSGFVYKFIRCPHFIFICPGVISILK